jgi:hypothetical protein
MLLKVLETLYKQHRENLGLMDLISCPKKYSLSTSYVPVMFYIADFRRGKTHTLMEHTFQEHFLLSSSCVLEFCPPHFKPQVSPCMLRNMCRNFDVRL